MLFVFCCGISIDVFFGIKFSKWVVRVNQDYCFNLLQTQVKTVFQKILMWWENELRLTSPELKCHTDHATYCSYWPPDDHNAETGFGWTAPRPSGLWSGDKWRLQWCRLLKNVQNKFVLFALSYYTRPYKHEVDIYKELNKNVLWLY